MNKNKSKLFFKGKPRKLFLEVIGEKYYPRWSYFGKININGFWKTFETIYRFNVKEWVTDNQYTAIIKKRTWYPIKNEEPRQRLTIPEQNLKQRLREEKAFKDEI